MNSPQAETPQPGLPNFPLKPGQTSAVQESIRLLHGVGFRVSITPFYSEGSTCLSLMLIQSKEGPTQADP